MPIDTSGSTELATFLKINVLITASWLAYQAYSPLGEIPQAIKDGYREVVSLLNGIAKGTAVLPAGAPVAETTSTGITGESFGHARQFTEDGMKDL